MLLDLPRYIICSVARFRLRAHTLPIETATWTHNTSPTCDLCNANDVQDEQHILFHFTHPHVVSLQRTYVSLFPPAGFSNVSALGQENNTPYFFLHALMFFYEQASSRTSCLKAFFLLNLVTLMMYKMSSMSFTSAHIHM